MTFKDFWSNDNNPVLPMSEYLYGVRHWIVLVLVLVATIVFSLIFRKKSQKTKNILFVILGSILLFFEISSRVVNLIDKDHLDIESIAKIILPMHICSVMVWVIIIASFTKNKTLYNYSVIGGILATMAFLLYPGTGLNHAYLNFPCLYSISSHCIGFVFCILLITLGQVEFKFKQIWQPLLCFTIMFLWGALLNFVIFPRSNYMYMVEDPLNLNINFPYQILYGIGILIYVSLYYVIYWLIHKPKKK